MATQQLVTKTDIYKVPFSKLVIIDGFNDREDYGDIPELAESIRAEGPRVPLKGYRDGDKFVVIVGHRRHRAAEWIKKQYKEEIVFKFECYAKGASKAEMLMDTLLTNAGKELTPLEKANVVKKLVTEKMTVKAIAAALGGVSSVYITNLSKLADAPDKVKKHIRDGNVSATLVIGYLKNKDCNIEELVTEIEKNLEPDEGLFKGKKKKKKQAAVTKKNLNKKKKDTEGSDDEEDTGNSMKTFKRYMKQNTGIFATPEKQATFEFVSDLVNNKVTYTDMVKYFTGK
jgi:ParB/RepB/Spo0J family partition protein